MQILSCRLPDRRRGPAALPLILLFFGLSLPWLFSSPNVEAASGSQEHREIKVKGGLKTWFVERRALPLVTLHLVLPGGSASDPVGQEGIARLTADALRAGAGARDSSALAEAIDALGADLSVQVGRDSTTLTLEALSRDAAAAVALLADLAIRPTFEDVELERIRRQQLASIRARADSPGEAAGAAFIDQLYRGHPYGHPVSGYEDSVAALTREQVVAFHAGLYQPSLARLVVVGDVPEKVLRSALDRAFGEWSAARKGIAPRAFKAPPVPPSIVGRQVILVHKAGLTQAQLRLGNLGAPFGAEGEVERMLLNTALGAGFTSRLVEEIRIKRSLSYNASSRFSRWQQPGPFVVSTFSKNETVGETVKVALETLEGLHSRPPGDEEFARARASALGTHAQEIQLPEALAAALGQVMLYGLPADYEAKLPSRLEAASLTQVLARLGDVPSEHLLIVVYADKTAVQAQLELLGPVKVVEELRWR